MGCLGDRLYSPPIGLDDQVRDLPVQGIPLLHQLPQNFFLVSILEQWPFASSLGTLELLPDEGMQVGHKTSGAQATTAFRIGDCTAARCKYDAFPLRQLVDDFNLALRKPSSPSFSNMKGMPTPVRVSISSSLSTNSRCTSRAR